MAFLVGAGFPPIHNWGSAPNPASFDGGISSAAWSSPKGLSSRSDALGHPTKKASRMIPKGFLSVSAVRTGLEPATPGVTGPYSNQLNYRTKISIDLGLRKAFSSNADAKIRKIL